MRSNFNRLLAASTLSNLGDGVVISAFPLMAASLSSSPQAVAGMTAAATLPWLLFGLPAGVVVDRVNRIRLMWSVDLGRALAVAALGLMILNGNASLAALYGVVFVLGMAETLFDSAAMAVVPGLVGGDSLEKANGRLFAGQLTANQFVGPPLGALLFAAAASLPPLVDAATFLISAFLLVGIRSPRPNEPVERRSLLFELREGLAWVWQSHNIRTLAIGAAVINLAHTAAMAVLVLFAIEVLGLTALGYGSLFVLSAVGALVGSLTASRVVGQFGRRTTVLGSVAVMAISLAAIGVTRSVVATAIGLLAISLGGEFWNVVAVSYRQNATPDRLLGRVMSAYRFVAYGSFPLGALLGGWLAAAFGLPSTFVLGAALIAALLLFMLVALGDLDRSP
jgi:MFS family permease